MVAEIQYGGKITDDMDRRLFAAYTARWLSPDIEASDFSFEPAKTIGSIPGNFQYMVPLFGDHEQYLKYCAEFPEIDSPEVSGLHPNAALTMMVKEANKMLRGLAEARGNEAVSYTHLTLPTKA